MSEDLSKDVWSKQFYKALEAVGNLTEQERNRLGEMLVSLSSIKEKYDFDSEVPLPARITTEGWKPSYKELKHVVLEQGRFKHSLSVEELPKHTCGAEFYKC